VHAVQVCLEIKLQFQGIQLYFSSQILTFQTTHVEQLLPFVAEDYQASMRENYFLGPKKVVLGFLAFFSLLNLAI